MRAAAVMAKEIDKLWGGRFTEPTDALVEAYTASVQFDQRLYRHDITASIAHARMLAHCDAIISGLEKIMIDIERGDFAWAAGFEDVHMNIEARLTERIGDAGKKLHTARSRNDQVATDLRLYLRDEVGSVTRPVRELRGTGSRHYHARVYAFAGGPADNVRSSHDGMV